jgi:hypothetical protein
LSSGGDVSGHSPCLPAPRKATRLSIPATKTGAMANLDLIVACDTTIAHRAGALGRRFWVHLKQVPDWRWLLDREDWRWLLDREDCPWYPARRLFRQ